MMPGPPSAPRPFLGGAAGVRQAVLTDAPELGRLLTPLGYSVSEEDVRARWTSWVAEGNTALVVEGDAGLLGVVTLHRMTVLHRAKPVGRITSLAVDPEAQGRGLGRALMAAADRYLRQAGCGLLEVTSHERRSVAHSFYGRMGMERTSVRFAKRLDGEETDPTPLREGEQPTEYVGE